MKSILVIHQSSELYGSDKTILFFLSKLDKSKYFPVIILPDEGPLKTELERAGIKVHIAPVLKVYRRMFTPKNLLLFAKQYRQGLRELDMLHRQYNFRLVYSHTLAVMLGILFARKHNIKHLWHIQEIISKPAIFNRLFTKLLEQKSNHIAVYDSIQTMRFWADGHKLSEKSVAVWNGIDTESKPYYSPEDLQRVRHKFFKAQDGEVVIGLIGRINGWKGQQLLLKAFNLLSSDHNNIRLVFVGSPPAGQDFFLTELKEKIEAAPAQDRIVIVPFQEEIWKFWDAIDIAVVPSTLPEPFGMVAIEAMSAKKPVVAANHGGLTEIVVHNDTGYLFIPGNEQDLAVHIAKLIDDRQMRVAMGNKGFNRVNDEFSLSQHVQKFEKIFDDLLST